ncbi:MAG: RNA-binding domain-containing protein [Nitrososphaeraceae archaeon]|jgi:RNA binding exosome subunit
MQKEKFRSFEIAAAEIVFLVHATEDKDRVLKLVSSILFVDKNEFESAKSLGHWGNHIDIIKARLDGKPARDVTMNILTSLDTYDRKKLLHSLDNYTDEKGNLHLRLDKQKICEGKIELSDIDSVKIKFKPKLFFSRIKQEYIREYRRLLDSND